jgi:protein DGCR14
LDLFTVQTYLEKYTSEDNASFEELFELGKKRERIQNAWMYEAEKKHNESLVSQGQLMLTNADEQLVAKSNESGLDFFVQNFFGVFD